MAAATTSMILVVDDNDVSRYSKARVLRAAGFEVREAASGGEALRQVAERSPNLVILDVQLPDLSGWEICRLIKADQATLCFDEEGKDRPGEFVSSAKTNLTLVLLKKRR